MRRIKRQIRNIKELIERLVASELGYRQLDRVSGPSSDLEQEDILLFATVRNEIDRLDYFFEYYRCLGVKRFFIVDNASDDGTTSYLIGQEDVVTYYTEASYKRSNFGMHWLNSLLRRFGNGHWCITCDPDEFLVFPHDDNRSLLNLLNHLDFIQQNAFFALMVDMYSDQSIDKTDLEQSASPLNACPYFDSLGYREQYSWDYNNLFVQGGVRQRVFFRDDPHDSPALNKIPLVKWRWYYHYVSSMHMLFPRGLNSVAYATGPTGGLLHFKFVSLASEKVIEEIDRGQHYNDSVEYKLYKEHLDKGVILYDPSVSVKYDSWRTLTQHKLMKLGSYE